jgi:aminoglycoside 6'-N-acetyltransferase
MNLNFRVANINDLAILNYWDKQQHVIDSDPDDDWNWEFELNRFPAWREQLIAQIDEIPLGLVQIIDPAEEESNYWGSVPKNLRAIDIWIGEKENLGKGYGTKMMNLALERCFKNSKVTAVLIDPLESNIDAIRFYESLGFQYVEKRIFGESICLVYEMTRSNWENRTT